MCFLKQGHLNTQDTHGCVQIRRVPCTFTMYINVLSTCMCTCIYTCMCSTCSLLSWILVRNAVGDSSLALMKDKNGYTAADHAGMGKTTRYCMHYLTESCDNRMKTM